MSGPALSLLITAAFSYGGEIASWRAFLTGEQLELLERVLANLRDLGQVAAFAVEPDRYISSSEVIDELRSRCGPLAVEACLSAPVQREKVRPAFLMPVWAFDHELDGAPASTVQFLGLDLELIATPSPDEEIGAHLPGRAGRWS